MVNQLACDVNIVEQATLHELENGQPAGLEDAQAEAQVSAGGERFGCSGGEFLVPAPDEPSPERPVSKPKPVRKKPLPPGAAKMLHLLKEADRIEGFPELCAQRLALSWRSPAVSVHG